MKRKTQLAPFLEGAFQSSLPCYLLDPSYCFIDWNPAFDEIVAIPLNLERGQHVSEFVKQLNDKDRLFARAAKVFGVTGNVPAVDSETLIWNSKRFGEIEFHKLATQVCDEGGTQVGWVVQLSIRRASKFQELSDAVVARITREWAKR